VKPSPSVSVKVRETMFLGLSRMNSSFGWPSSRSEKKFGSAFGERYCCS